jgi:hypothetical protein
MLSRCFHHHDDDHDHDHDGGGGGGYNLICFGPFLNLFCGVLLHGSYTHRDLQTHHSIHFL